MPEPAVLARGSATPAATFWSRARRHPSFVLGALLSPVGYVLQALEARRRRAAATAVRRIADLPGPKGWPVLGNLPQIKAAEFHLQLERWAHEYGRFFQIRMANRHMLVIADHEAVAAMLRDRPEGFKRTERLQLIGAEMGQQE